MQDPTTAQPRPRPCPVCRVAMVAEKSDPQSPRYDRYVCFNCGTVIAIKPVKDAAAGD